MNKCTKKNCPMNAETLNPNCDLKGCPYRTEISGDLISREQAINELKLAYFDKDLQSTKDDPCIVDAMTDWAIRIIKKLEPVTPQPKVGHWIDIETLDSALWHECSECGETEFYATDYCPNCGARMIEVRESEDEK